MLRIFLKMKEQYIKTEMEYTFNFWMMLLSGVLTRILSLAVPFVIYSNIPSIAGWDKMEIYLIMSFLCIAEGLCSVLFEGVWMIPEMVFNGQLDNILSRPIAPLFQILSYGIGLHGIAVMIFGVVSLNICLVSLGCFNVLSVVMSVYFVICGTIICLSVYILGNSLVFWFDSGGKTNIPYTISSVGQYAKYPVSIYPNMIRLILLFLIPYAFIGEIPVVILRGEHVVSYSLALFAMSLIFFLLARSVFYRGIRNYESMGM